MTMKLKGSRAEAEEFLRAFHQLDTETMSPR
jgi:hypothetical protein